MIQTEGAAVKPKKMKNKSNVKFEMNCLNIPKLLDKTYGLMMIYLRVCANTNGVNGCRHVFD